MVYEKAANPKDKASRSGAGESNIFFLRQEAFGGDVGLRDLRRV
jgi:hypothetical protein